MQKQRSLALDVFRGFTVALMILVNNPGSWSHVYPPLKHASWHGLTPTDLVFPFFLFAVGNAAAFVLPRLWEQGQSEFFKKVFKRTCLIFLIGFFLNWYPFLHWPGDELVVKGWSWMSLEGKEMGVRIPGVLQRIALAYGAAATLVFYFPRKILTTGMVLLLLYWLLVMTLGTGDVHSLEGYFGTIIDRGLFGAIHIYQGEGVAFDPEGLMSTIPSVAQVLLGYWAGRKMLSIDIRKVPLAFGLAGLAFNVTGLVWSIWHPINKKIWTGSYVLITTGLALMLLALFVQLLDIKKYRAGMAYFFEAFGKNPLFIYAFSILFPRTLNLIRLPAGEEYLTPLQWFYQQVAAQLPGPPENGSLFYALCLVTMYGLLAIWLDRKRMYFRV